MSVVTPSLRACGIACCAGIRRANIIGSTGRKQVCANVLTDDTVLVYVCACMEDGIPLQLIKTTFMLHFIRIYICMYVYTYI